MKTVVHSVLIVSFVVSTAIAQDYKRSDDEIYEGYDPNSAARASANYALKADSSLTNESGYYATYPQEEIGSEVYRAEYDPEGSYRQPMDIEFIDERIALITTKLAGQLYELKIESKATRLVHQDKNRSWGSVVRLAPSVVALADHQQNEVVVMQRRGDAWRVSAKLDAPGFPNDLVWCDEQQALLASAKWGQRLYRWQFQSHGSKQPSQSTDFSGANWSPLESVDLPMCGGQVLYLPKNEVILVVDAFGRDYAIVSEKDFQLQHHAQLYGHNVSALATTSDESLVFFPHQLLNEFARSVRTDITWGGLMSNNIRWLRTERLIGETGAEVFKKGKFYPLGTPGNGAGDPSSMTVSSTGRIAITLGGTNRIAIGNEDDYYFRQVDVGYHPVACAYSPEGTQVVVVNQFSDSLSIVELEDFSVEHIALGKLRPPTEVELGEQLFFNSRLSHDGWMSCHSCHSGGHTNGQLNDNFSDKTFGTPKRVLSLLGQAETMPYAWAGSVHSIEQQVANSVVSTMAGTEPNQVVVRSIASFVRSLPEPPSLLEARQQRNSVGRDSRLEHTVSLGQKVFADRGCADCHSGERFTSTDVFDVGLHDEDSMTHFNPPSLVSISQRQNSLLHDGSAKSIRDVVAVQKHQLSEPLEPNQVDALVEFLMSL